ncbi:MAG: hypothetical protein ACYTEY_07740 [Planctomycetota bacterium]|jgi:hypothetical protein
MNLSTIRIACVVTALLSGAAVAQTGTAGSMTSAQRAEFTKLVHQRNALYNPPGTTSRCRRGPSRYRPWRTAPRRRSPRTE